MCCVRGLLLVSGRRIVLGVCWSGPTKGSKESQSIIEGAQGIQYPLLIAPGIQWIDFFWEQCTGFSRYVIDMSWDNSDCFPAGLHIQRDRTWFRTCFLPSGSLTWRVTMVGPWANDIFQAAWGMFRDPTHPRALQKRKLNEMLSILRRRPWADALVAASISVIFNLFRII